MKKLLFLFGMMLLSTCIFSQELRVLQDCGLWAGVSVEKKVFNNFEFSFQQQIRSYHNFTKIDDLISDIGISYSINKHFNVSGGLRYTYNIKRDESIENNFRYNLDFAYKLKIRKRFVVSYRLRYQTEYIDLLAPTYIKAYNISDFRNRLKFQYKINELNKIYASVELYKTLQRFRDPYFNKLRFFLGDEIKSSIGIFDCALGFEREINTSYPMSFVFVSLFYTLNL